MEYNGTIDYDYITPRNKALYPEINVEAKNPRYAEMMLYNMAGRDSEMSTISLFMYNIPASAAERSEWIQRFRNIIVDEMRHMEIFGRMALLLGADPRLWTTDKFNMRYWSPGSVKYPKTPIEILQYSVDIEEIAVKRYRTQLLEVKDEYIIANLDRIIAEEETHMALFRRLLTEEEGRKEAATS